MSGHGSRVAKPIDSEKEANRGRVQAATVQRYWPGEPMLSDATKKM